MADEQLDLTDWLAALETKLAYCTLEFDKADAGPVERQYAAFAALAFTVTHLRGLPGLSEVTKPLEELAHALDVVTEGRTSELLSNHTGTAGGRGLSSREKARKARGVAAVEILIEAGWKEKPAAQMVAAWMAEVGIVGNRRKAPITISTVRAWRTDADSGEHPDIRKEADRYTAMMRRIFESSHGCWPPSKPQAEHLVSLAISNGS